MDVIFRDTDKVCPKCGQKKVSKHKLLLVCDCGWYMVKGRINPGSYKTYISRNGKRIQIL